MLKLFRVAVASVCLVPALALAAEGAADEARKPRPELPAAAFKACEGKSAGDKAKMEGPEGKPFEGVCRKVEKGLALVPERGEHGKGGHERMGPPPEAFKACEGKSAGDKVSFSAGPEGREIQGTCRDLKGKLAAMGEREPGAEPDHAGHGAKAKE